MKQIAKVLSVFALAFFLSGCYTTGLSARESGQFNYSNFVYGLYSDSKTATAKPTSVKKPIKLAVAQIGESTPSSEFLEKLKKQDHLIDNVFSIPATGPEKDKTYYYQEKQKEYDPEYFDKQTDRMCRLAQDLGAEYLYIFGGSVDYTGEPNALSFLDITIIGAFLFPGMDHYAEGKVSGAFIDLKTKRVLFIAEYSDTVKKSTPSYLDSYGKGGGDLIIAQLRKKLIFELGEEMLKKLSAL